MDLQRRVSRAVRPWTERGTWHVDERLQVQKVESSLTTPINNARAHRLCPLSPSCIDVQQAPQSFAARASPRSHSSSRVARKARGKKMVISTGPKSRDGRRSRKRGCLLCSDRCARRCCLPLACRLGRVRLLPGFGKYCLVMDGSLI